MYGPYDVQTGSNHFVRNLRNFATCGKLWVRDFTLHTFRFLLLRQYQVSALAELHDWISSCIDRIVIAPVLGHLGMGFL